MFREGQNAAPTKNAELQFRKACKEALADGKLTPQDESQLKSLAKFLNIPSKHVKQMFAEQAKLLRQGHPQNPAT